MNFNNHIQYKFISRQILMLRWNEKKYVSVLMTVFCLTQCWQWMCIH